MKKKLRELKARREDCRLKAVAIMERAEKENRTLTEDEDKDVTRLEKEMRGWDTQIIRLEVFKPDGDESEPGETNKKRNDPEDEEDEDEDDGEDEDEEENSRRSKRNPKRPKEGVGKDTEPKFRSLGDQMMAVYRASQPGGKVDNRLTTRQASGLNQSNPSDGGFLVQKDFVGELLKRAYETGILASRIRKISISTNANGLKINAIDEDSRKNGSRYGGIQTYWEGEAAEITASKPKFRQIEMSLKKLTGLCYVTDELMQDASALETVIQQAFAEEFGFKLDDAILAGTGAGQPLGLLKSGALVKVEKETGQTDKIVVDNITKMYARLPSKSKTKAVWFINPEIEPSLYTLKIGDTPVYVPAGGLSAKPYGTLLGLPVIPLEQCSELGETGDIILCDLAEYLGIDKGGKGIDTASSIHVRFLYDENVFRFIFRFDGQPLWNKSLQPYKGAANISPFVALAKR